MSSPVAKKPRIFYGPIDGSALAAASASESSEDSPSEPPSPPPVTNRSGMSAISLEEQRAHTSLIAAVEVKHRAAALLVPIEENSVKRSLRVLRRPITIFGEKAGHRRERLRELMAKATPEEIEKIRSLELSFNAPAAAQAEEESDEPASPELVKAREKIKQFSENSSAERHRLDSLLLRDRTFYSDVLLRSQTLRVDALGSLEAVGSQIGDTRPLSGLSFNDDGNFLAISSWSGISKLWAVDGGRPLAILGGHQFNISDIQFNSKVSTPAKTMVASCGLDGLIHVYTPDLASLASADIPMRETDDPSEDEEPLLPEIQPVLSFHTPQYSRCSRLVFHPSNRFLICTAFDRRWHLFDLEHGQALCAQGGHGDSTYGLAVNADGNLLCCGDLDGIGRTWDLRVGVPIWDLKGHAQKILSADWHANGFLMATGSADHSIKVWDIRRRETLYTIAAHDHLVSNVRWCPDSNATIHQAVQEAQKEKFAFLPNLNRALTNSFLLSSSYDRTVKIWDGYTFELRRDYSPHSDLITRAEWRPDGKSFATTSFDRTWKIFKNQQENQNNVKEEKEDENIKMDENK